MSAGSFGLLLLGIVLAIASGALSAIETAMFSMTQERRRKLRVRDSRRAAMFDMLMTDPDDVANTLLLANTVTNLPLLVIILHLVQVSGYSEVVPAWALLVLAFGVIVVLCDLLPKLAALAAPVRTTRLSLPLVMRLIPMLRPICGFFQRLSERVVAAVIPSRMSPVPHLTDEELETLVEIGREEGTFDRTESRLLREIMKLADESARHCMTPRVDAFTLPDDLTNEQVIERVRRKRYRLVPVRGETPDDLLGLLDVKDFLLRPEVHYMERLQPPSFVPETMKALDLLRSFLAHRQHFAILLDEYGGIEGIVTLSDLIEELLGEEGPDSRSELYIERLSRDRFLAAGNAQLDDLAEEGIKLADDTRDIETIGGLVVEHFGSLPRPGESFTIGDWRIIVRRATRKRIKEVLIELAPEETGEEVAE